MSGKHHSHFSHHSHQHPCSPDPNHLINWFPAPAATHQATLYQHSLHTRSSSSLPFTTPNSTWLTNATNLCVLTFQFPSLLQRSSPVRHQTHCSGFPATKETLSILQDVQRTIFSISIHLPFLSSITLSCYSINLLVIHLPVCVWPVSWQKTGPGTNTSMDPLPPSPAEVLEELVNTLRASLMPITNPISYPTTS